MKNKKSEPKEPQIWFWNEPANGQSVEECEEIATSTQREQTQEQKQPLQILFVALLALLMLSVIV
ncbi:MAG: hypothetical protein ACI30I_03565 [Parabacteroides sp.]